MFKNLKDKIESYFQNEASLTKEELINCITSDFPRLKSSTLSVYLSKFKKKGIITNPSRGLYSLSNKNVFSPNIDVTLEHLFNQLKSEYPFVEMCIWNTKWLNEFMRHQVFRYYTVLEVDKEATESIFYKLKEEGEQVFLEPDTDTYNLYINSSNDVIILRALISEAPLSIKNNIKVPTLEKLLVDMTIDKELFGSQRAELESIYENAFQKYQINRNKMNRYALRRNRVEEVKKLFNLTLAKK